MHPTGFFLFLYPTGTFPRPTRLPPFAISFTRVAISCKVNEISPQICWTKLALCKEKAERSIMGVPGSRLRVMLSARYVKWIVLPCIMLNATPKILKAPETIDRGTPAYGIPKYNKPLVRALIDRPGYQPAPRAADCNSEKKKMPHLERGGTGVSLVRGCGCVPSRGTPQPLAGQRDCDKSLHCPPDTPWRIPCRLSTAGCTCPTMPPC